MSPPQRRFLLRKWYLDCVTEDGSAVVAYWASLCWGALRMRYAALLCGATGRDAWQIHTLRPGAPPSLEGERCDWQCPRLGLTGSWTARAGRVGRVLLRTAEGGIRWVCHQPAADVRVDILRPGAPAITLRGSGYVEELTLTMPPWELPFSTLLWGRFVAEDASMVWIRWRGQSPGGLTLVDGTLHSEPRVRDGTVAVPGTALLRMEEGRSLRDGTLANAALRNLTRLVPLLPRAFREARENKQVSRAELHRCGCEPVSGWTLHEVVKW
jgi:hypothetical protein